MNYSIGKAVNQGKRRCCPKGIIRGTKTPYNQLFGLGLNMFTDDELADA